MRIYIGVLVFSLVIFVLIGAGVGFFVATPKMFSDSRFGETPAHSCVVDARVFCGMYVDSDLGVIEVSRDSQGTKRVFKGLDSAGRAIYASEPIEPTRLTEQQQIDEVFSSRVEFFEQARRDSVTQGALVGFSVWFVIMAGLAAYVVISVVRSHHRTVSQSLSKWGRSIGQSARATSNSIGETAKLRSEVRKSELLVRKAAAEAKLKRQNPDAVQHEIEMRQKR